jgi:hypothetical protein
MTRAENDGPQIKTVFWATITGSPALVEFDTDIGYGVQWFLRDAQGHMNIDMYKVMGRIHQIHENCLSVAHKKGQMIRVTTLWKTWTDGTISPVFSFDDIEGIDTENVEISCEIVKPAKPQAPQPPKSK